jgi:hypothetical protein
MQQLSFLPETIATEDYRERVSLLKRQITILLKFTDEAFREQEEGISTLLQSVFYFSPLQDDELYDLVSKLTRRFTQCQLELDFLVFVDAVDYFGPDIDSVLPSTSSTTSTNLKIHSVPSMFTKDFVCKHPEFSKAWKTLNPECKADVEKPVDETVALLNDKSFVKEFKQVILDTQYEDELVDNEDFPDDSQTQNSSNFTHFSEPDVTLLGLLINSPQIFEKSERKSAERAKICNRLKMSPEQFEGWASMMKRNPQREAILWRFGNWQLSLNRQHR